MSVICPLHLFLFLNRTQTCSSPLLAFCAQVFGCAHESTLFRTNSFATKLFKTFSKLNGVHYVHDTLGYVLNYNMHKVWWLWRAVVACGGGVCGLVLWFLWCAVDPTWEMCRASHPSSLPEKPKHTQTHHNPHTHTHARTHARTGGQYAETNFDLRNQTAGSESEVQAKFDLLAVCQRVFVAIVKSAGEVPPIFRDIFAHVRACMVERFPIAITDMEGVVAENLAEHVGDTAEAYNTSADAFGEVLTVSHTPI